MSMQNPGIIPYQPQNRYYTKSQLMNNNTGAVAVNRPPVSAQQQTQQHSVSGQQQSAYGAVNVSAPPAWAQKTASTVSSTQPGQSAQNPQIESAPDRFGTTSTNENPDNAAKTGAMSDADKKRAVMQLKLLAFIQALTAKQSGLTKEDAEQTKSLLSKTSLVAAVGSLATLASAIAGICFEKTGTEFLGHKIENVCKYTTPGFAVGSLALTAFMAMKARAIMNEAVVADRAQKGK